MELHLVCFAAQSLLLLSLKFLLYFISYSLDNENIDYVKLCDHDLCGSGICVVHDLLSSYFKIHFQMEKSGIWHNEGPITDLFKLWPINMPLTLIYFWCHVCKTISNSSHGWKSYRPSKKYTLHLTMLTFDNRVWPWPSCLRSGHLHNVSSYYGEYLCQVIRQNPLMNDWVMDRNRCMTDRPRDKHSYRRTVSLLISPFFFEKAWLDNKEKMVEKMTCLIDTNILNYLHVNLTLTITFLMVANLCHSCCLPATPPSEKSRINKLKWQGHGAKTS
jgi:hypothetical protein